MGRAGLRPGPNCFVRRYVQAYRSNRTFAPLVLPGLTNEIGTLTRLPQHLYCAIKFLPVWLAYLYADVPLGAQEYIAKVEYYGVEQGLSHRQVNTIFQDSRGFVWIGTPLGLNRFDGYTFRHYTKEKDGLRFNYIQEIAEDADGWLWLVDMGQKSICLFHPERGEVLSLEEKFGKTHPNFARQRFEYKILTDEERAIWLPSFRGDTLYRYHPANGVQSIPVKGLSGKLHPVCFSARKTMWASSGDDNIVELSRDGTVLQRIRNAWLYGNWALSDKRMLTITREPVGAERLLLYDDKGQEQPYLPPQLARPTGPNPALIFSYDTSTFVVHDRLTDMQGRVLAQWEFEQHDWNNYLWRGYMKDRDGRYWLGDDFGFYILQIKKNRFQHYFYKKGARPALGNSVRGILVARDKLYANLEQQGLFEHDLRSGKVRAIATAGKRWGNYALYQTANGEI